MAKILRKQLAVKQRVLNIQARIKIHENHGKEESTSSWFCCGGKKKESRAMQKGALRASDKESPVADWEKEMAEIVAEQMKDKKDENGHLLLYILQLEDEDILDKYCQVKDIDNLMDYDIK